MPNVRAQPRSSAPRVLVVSNHAETLDGMQDYFSQARIASLGRRTINSLAELAGSLRAVVVFPDDFPPHEIASYLFMVRMRRPDLTLVIVTKEVPLYASMTAANGLPLSAIVLPRPAFGWKILDAILVLAE